jgi:hypothetical protein
MDAHRRTTKQRVFNILEHAMVCWERDRALSVMVRDVYDHDQLINLKPGGWVPQSVFANVTITGSTEGKRRLRELRADPELQDHYVFEKKHDGQRWYYRIRSRAALKMTLAEV